MKNPLVTHMTHSHLQNANGMKFSVLMLTESLISPWMTLLHLTSVTFLDVFFLTQLHATCLVLFSVGAMMLWVVLMGGEPLN